VSVAPLPAFVRPRSNRLWAAERDTAASPAVLAAALSVGVLAALTLGPQVAGSAYFVAGVGVLAVALGARAGRLSRPQMAAVAVTVALLVVTILRSAPWLVVLCLFAAWVVGTLALVGGRTWTGLAVGALVAGLVPPRAARWVQRSFAAVRLPGLRSRRGWLVVAVSAGLVALFGALFATADAAYATLLDGALPSVNIPDTLRRLFVLGVVAAAAIVAAYLGNQPPTADALAPPSGRPVRRWEWAVPLTVLDLLFVSFVVVQLTVLFGGRAHVVTTQGLTYAQYARQGFWQLLVVTGLTLAVVAIAVRTAPRATPTDLLLVRFLLALLCLLALVVVASALHRMSLYEQEYGFTRLRLFVDTVELALGAIFILLLAAGIQMTNTWLPRAVVATAAVALLALAALNPDAYVAEHNVTRYEQTGRIDLAYLATLSADAVPALVRLPTDLRACALMRLAPAVRDSPDPWYDFNLARIRARESMRTHPIEDCRSAAR
jgi:MFS family permease